jgi:hypothetical protein
MRESAPSLSHEQTDMLHYALYALFISMALFSVVVSVMIYRAELSGRYWIIVVKPGWFRPRLKWTRKLIEVGSGIALLSFLLGLFALAKLTTSIESRTERTLSECEYEAMKITKGEDGYKTIADACMRAKGHKP